MYLKEAEIKNFKSIKYSTVYLTNEPILILGDNKDESGTDSNSAGKSNFIDAILWALFGSKFIASPIKNLIRWGEERMSVSLIFNNPSVKIHRKRLSKESADALSIKFNNKDVIGTTTLEIEQNFMEQMGINLPLKDFVYNTLLIKEGKSFFTLSSSEQERVIKDLLKLSLLHNYYDKSNEKKSNINDELHTNSIRLDNLTNTDEIDEKSIQNNIDNIKKQIDRLPSEDSIQKEINDLNDKINVLQSQRIEKRNDVERANKTIIDITNNLEELKERYITEQSNLTKINDEYNTLSSPSKLDQWLPRVESIKEQVDNLKEKKSSHQYQKDQMRKEFEYKNATLKSGKDQVCPKCNTNLIFSGGKLVDFDIDTVKKEIDDLVSRIENIQIEIDSYESKIKEGNGFLDKIYSRQQELSKIDLLKEQKKNGEEFIKSYNTTKGIFETQLKDSEQQSIKFNKYIGDLSSKIDGLKKSKQEQADLLSGDTFKKRRELINKLDELNKRFSNAKATNLIAKKTKEEREKIRKNNKRLNIRLNKFDTIGKLAMMYEKKAMNDFLPKLSSLINLYLSKMEINERITIQAGEEKSRKKKDKFNFNFFNGVVEGDGTITSCGKKERIQIAQILGLSEILNSQLKYPFKFIIGDEIISNIDNTGVQFIVDLFRSLGIQLLLVLQRSEQISNCKNIVVRKENGISKIE